MNVTKKAVGFFFQLLCLLAIVPNANARINEDEGRELQPVRPKPPSPYDFLPFAPTFHLTSTAFENGGRLPLNQTSGMFGVPGGEDESPHLEWSGFPDHTKSFVVTCFDPDAPTVSGFWHWAVYDIPADVTSLPTGGALPEGAKTLKNDAGFPGYVGAAPPPGDCDHRYIFVVSALGEENIDIDEDMPPNSPAILGSELFDIGVKARAFLTGIYGRDETGEFEVQGKATKKTCSWVAADPKKRCKKKLKENGKKLRTVCRVACDNCS